MKFPTKLFCPSLRQKLCRCFWHVTIWTTRFESKCIFISKIIHKNLHIITQLVFFVFYILFGILSIYTNGLFISIYTDDFSDEKNIVSNYHCKISMKKNCRWFSLCLLNFCSAISKAFKTKLLNAWQKGKKHSLNKLQLQSTPLFNFGTNFTFKIWHIVLPFTKLKELVDLFSEVLDT